MEVSRSRTTDRGKKGQHSTHVLVRKWAGSERGHDASRRNGTRQLRDAVQHEPRWPDAAEEEEGEADVGVEEPARGAEEEPGGHEQAEPESRRNVEHALEVRPHNYVMRALDPAEGYEQKHGRPDKFDGSRLGIIGECRLWPVISKKRRLRFHRRMRLG